MKILINIIAIFALTVQISFAQDLNMNMAKVAKDWETIKKEFKKELQEEKDLFDTVKWRIESSSILFEIDSKDEIWKKWGNRSSSYFQKYNEIRKAYLEKLANNPKYALPKGDEKDLTLQSNEKIDSLQNENAKLQSQIDTLKSNLPNANQKLAAKTNKPFLDKVLDNWFWILIVLLETALIVFLVKKWLKVDDENEEFRNKIQTLKMQKTSSENQLRTLQNQKPKEKIVEKEVVKTVYVEKEKTDNSKQIFYKYLCQINGAEGGYFKRVQDSYDGSSSYYRMFNINDGEAEYEFFGDAERAIKKWSSLLDSVAEYDGDTDTATKIETIKPGKVKYDSAAERWNVIKKAKLKLY